MCVVGKKKKYKQCRHLENPANSTFFDGAHCRIEVREVIIIAFISKMKVNELNQQLLAWRRHEDGEVLRKSTVIDYYSYCREITEVVASNSDIRLGGDGKTVQIDETFLINRKYHSGRITERMTITVLGIYCKEDKTGPFFKVNSKSQADLWPRIKRYKIKGMSRHKSNLH